MATSRREPHQSARTNNRTVRNMSPALKPSESDQALLRRARSVPNSPDRRSSASPASAGSANASRPSSSFNPRTASSRSTSGSSSSSTAHGKSTLLHSVSAMVGANQAGSVMMRRRADTKSGGATSVWPHALTSPNPSPKDPASRAAAKSSPSPSSSSAQKSKLSTRPGAEKAAVASPKPRTTQKATGAAGKTQAASSSSARAPGATAKRRTGPESSAPSIQRTTSVPVAATKTEELEVDLLMEEFDEIESISDPSIEEHLQERLPDPVDFAATYAASEHAPSEPSSHQEEDKNGQEDHVFSEEKRDDLNGGGDDADDSEVVVAKEAADEAELNEDAGEAGLKESADETEVLNETVDEREMEEAVDEAKLNEDPELAVKEEAKANEERIVQPAKKTPEAMQTWRKDDERSNEVTEEGRSKTTTLQERRNKVMALVGRFETAMSGRE